MKAKPNITCPDYAECNGKFCEHILAPEHEGDKIYCALKPKYLCTEALKTEPSRVSHSAIQDHMRCPKLDYYKNVCGLEPVEQLASDAIKMGNVWEAWLEKNSTLIWSHEIEEQQLAKYEVALDRNPLPDKERAILRGLAFAMKSLQLSIPPGTWQRKDIVHITDSDNINHPVSFVLDVLHADTKSFSEIKLTSNSKYYDNSWVIKSQAGLYLALNPELEYCVMYVVVKPALKLKYQNKTNPRDETIEEYEKRVYDAVIGDGRKYFIDMRGDIDAGTRTWGRRFDRAEFDMDELRLRAIEVSKLRTRSMVNGYWMMNEKNCFMYGQDCEFLSVCKNHGRVSDRFRVKDIDNKIENKIEEVTP